MNAEKILAQINEIEDLKQERDRSSSAKFSAWKAATSRCLASIFGSDSQQKKDFDSIRYYWAYSHDEGAANYLKGLEQAKLHLESFLKEIPKNISNNINPTIVFEENLRRILNKFHAVAIQLGKRHNNREAFAIKDEYDVQDLLHALLQIHFNDIRSEESTPSHAGSSSRMDFLLLEEQTVIEVKKTRSGLKDKEIGQELTLDIAYYQAHPDCKKLIFFIYDPDYILRNRAALKSGLAKKHDSLEVEVFITPTL